MIEELKIKTETYYSLQKIRIQAELRIKAFVRDKRLTEIQTGSLHFWLDEQLLKAEKITKKDITTLLKGIPIWTEFMKDINGIGPCLAGSLIAGIVDIDRFNYVSSLWKYCGMDVVNGEAPKRRKGEKISWNPFLRMTIFKLTDSFVIQSADKCLYRRLYDEKKAYYRAQYPEPIDTGKKNKDGKPIYKYSDGHIHNMAKRYAGKIFIEHFWVKWRELEGLVVTQPWIIAHGGHQDYIPAEMRE